MDFHRCTFEHRDFTGGKFGRSALGGCKLIGTRPDENALSEAFLEGAVFL